MPDDLPPLDPIVRGGWTLDLDRYLRAEYDDISHAAAVLPPIIEWLNAELQVLIERKIIRKQRIKAVEGEVYLSLWNGGFKALYPDSKVTLTLIEQAVPLDERVAKAHEQYAITAGWCSRLQGTLLTFQSKLDLVRSSEATRRSNNQNEHGREEQPE